MGPPVSNHYTIEAEHCHARAHARNGKWIGEVRQHQVVCCCFARGEMKRVRVSLNLGSVRFNECARILVGLP